MRKKQRKRYGRQSSRFSPNNAASSCQVPGAERDERRPDPALRPEPPHGGQTAVQNNDRFHYALCVPPAVGVSRKVELLVTVHGTSRTSFLEFRDGFSAFGRWNDVAVLCQVFPTGVRGDGTRSGGKYIEEGDIRYDRVLLDMVAEVAANYRRDWSKFAVFGFSGGGHFAHRFSILHPERLCQAVPAGPTHR